MIRQDAFQPENNESISQAHDDDVATGKWEAKELAEVYRKTVRDPQQAQLDASIAVNKPSAKDQDVRIRQQKSTEDRKNATVIAIFGWMREKGRVVNVPKELLNEAYIDFPKPEPDTGAADASWGEADRAPTNEVSTVAEIETEILVIHCTRSPP